MGFTTADQPRPAMMARGGEAVDISSTDHTCAFPAHSLYARTSGDVKVLMVDGTDVTFVGIPNQTKLDNVSFTKVYKTGTTADGMVVLWG